MTMCFTLLNFVASSELSLFPTGQHIYNAFFLKKN